MGPVVSTRKLNYAKKQARMRQPDGQLRRAVRRG